MVEDSFRVVLADPLKFMTAGKAIFTVRSHRTGDHFTFRMRSIPLKPGRYFVSVLSGGSTFHYLGIAADRNFILTQASQYLSGDPRVRAFNWVWGRLNSQLPIHADILHEGKCGRCGRRLTDPDSIATGIGPECAKK